MADHNEHVHEHHITLGTHLKVFSALIGLTILTVYTAKFIDFGFMNVIIAFAIAITKGLLVMAYFMHLKYDEKVYKIIIGSSFGFVLLLYLFCVLDLGTRILHQSAL
jgi:cytochrome c oxidase subunit 4